MNIPAKPHILVIDDDISIRDLVAEYLGRNDMRVSAGASGREMFEVLEREAIDLVLLDLKLPRLNGFAVLSALRSRPGRRATVVVMTGSTLRDDRTRSQELGADLFVTKPVGVEAYVEEMKRFRALAAPG